MEFQIVDRVECPACYQRTIVELDCICCGGIGFVDTDRIESIVSETLADLESGTARASKNKWLAVGLYPMEDGTWFLLDQMRNTRRISNYEANQILFVEIEPYWVVSLLSRVEKIVSKLFSQIYSMIRKPVL